MGGVATAYPLLILHGTCKGSPIFLYVQLLPLLFYIFDILMRRSRTKTTKVLEWTSYDEDNGEHITELVIECPSTFKHTPGQYAELKFPPISTTKWHPFTIASAPSDDDLDISEFNDCVQGNSIEAGTKPKKKTKKLLFYIKSTGRWTEALYNYALAFDLNKAIKETEISIRGPHGAPAMNYFEYKHIIVIGSGIGVAPLMSIWKYLIQKRTSTTLREKSFKGSPLTCDDTSYEPYDDDDNEGLNEQTLLEQEQSEQQQKTMLRKISIKTEKVLESMTISMLLLLFFVMGETIAIVMQMFTFSNGANLFGSFMSIIALIVHGCNVIVSTIVVGPYLYIRLFKFWLEVCIIVVDSFALWISLIGYMYPNSYSQRANNTTYFYLFGVVVVLHAIRIFHIFYTTLKPPKDNNTNNNNKNNSFDNGSNQMCSIQGILINKYYSGMRFAAKSLMPPLGSKLFSMEFYGTREKPELKDVSGREEEIITDLMGKSEFVRISSFNSLTEIQNQNNNRGGSSTKQEDYLSFKCGRPDWRRIFLKAMAKAHAQTNNDKNSGSKVSRGESVGVFFCGSPAITADLQTMAKEVTAQHQFTKKHLDGKACKCKLIVHSENF